MDDSLQLQQNTGLRQRLTPQQVIFGHFLEMTAPELEDEVRRALDENPALETRDNVADENNPDHDDEDLFNESSEDLQRADYRDDDDDPSWRYNASNHSRDDDSGVPVDIDDHRSIIDVLSDQLSDFDLDDNQLTIARYIIGNIDSNGYLSRPSSLIADDISIATGRDVSTEQVRNVADVIRKMDPAGIGAYDLRDCLLLQLQRMRDSQAVENATMIIRDFFDLFSKRHYDRLASRAKLSVPDMRRAIDLIHSLNPKPGALIEQSNSLDRMRHIVPDFNVEVENDGKISVGLNGNLPELAISESFQPDKFSQSSPRVNNETRTFIRSRHDEALQLIRMVNSRAETLMRIMKAIAKLQLRFFESGNTADIRPMILKDVAELTGYDLSVISRATAAKYVSTPNGVFPLKMLFNERRKEDSETSAHEILDVIAGMIAEEDKHHPLTDEAIKERLTHMGYDIARRTVAKYREQLDLPVARLRRSL